MKILIVDDVEANREMLTVMLEGAGYTELMSADSAAEAFKLLGMEGEGKGAEEKAADVDLILMDIAMPEMDGIEACRRIKAVDRLRDVPVIMISAMMEKQLLGVAFDAGAVDYITKPVNKIELLARVSSALKFKEELDKHKADREELQEVKRQLEEAREELKKLTS